MIEHPIQLTSDTSRRIFLKNTARLGSIGAAGVLFSVSKAPAESSVSLDAYDPFKPLDKNQYEQLRATFRNPQDGSNLVKSLWEKYTNTGNFDYGHWAVIYCQVWWQSLPAGRERLKVSKIAITLAEKLRQAYPEHAAPPFWVAVHFGFDALVRGILDSLNVIPRFFKLLDESEAHDPSYLVGSGYLAKAKAYLKLPSFPMSTGSVKKGYKYLEMAAKYQETEYGLWHIVHAEAEMISKGEQAALAALKGLDKVCPSTIQSQYTFEISTWFAEKFETAVANGTYNKYTWDPLLEPILEMRNRKASYAPCHR